MTIKKDKLASKTFKYELGFAYAVIDEIKVRGERGNIAHNV